MERCGAMLCEDALRGFTLSGFVLGERLHREGEDAPYALLLGAAGFLHGQ